MFDLEKSIAEWRKHMLATGIKTPVPLEELESHLREEIEQQIESGLSAQQAFAAATEDIGKVQLLKTEFTKVGGVEKDDKWERRIGLLILICVIFPLSVYVLCKAEMNLGWRLAGFADLAVAGLAMLGWRKINRVFPVIPNKRTRIAIGLSFAFIGMAGMGVFMNFVLPRFEFTLARIFHSRIEQSSGERVRRLDLTQPNENTHHRCFFDRL